MNKIQGAIAGVAVATAGVIFHSSTPAISVAALPRSILQAAETGARKEVRNEGPWLASCQYWAPATMVPEKEQDTTDEKPACEGGSSLAGWGIPEAGGKAKGEITAIIAAVPDPIHTHLTLEFDRTIDALLQASAENGFVPSYFWLPWKAPPRTFKAAEDSASTNVSEDLKREREPGLIILKRVSHPNTATGTACTQKDAYLANYGCVIYLFLVGQTPTLGMNGTQLQRAFLYERDLQAHGARLSTKEGNQMSIISSNASGSAASLRAGIETAKGKIGASSIEVAGATSTELASRLLTSPDIHYVSFGENTQFERETLERLLADSAYSLDRVAILTEDGTVFGEQTARIVSDERFRKFETQKPAIIRFPREISLLRNAQTEETGGRSQANATPSPYLHLSLKDSSGDDSVPQFSRQQMPLSQESQLMAIARQLQLYRSQFIVIVASDVLDQLFLAQFLHRACPDARLVFFGGDLLFERETENAPFMGAVTISPFNLVTLEHSWSKRNPDGPARAFADSQSESYYNAASYTFWDGKSELKLAGYQNFLDPPTELRHAPLWVTAIGSDGYYPLGILNECSSNSDTILPAIVGGQPQPCPTSLPADRVGQKAPNQKAPDIPRLPIYPSLAWVALCGMIVLLCIAHVTVLLVANYWSPFTRDLAIRQNEHPRRRAMYIHIGTAMLFCMTFVVAYPLFPTFRFCVPTSNSVLVGIFTLAAGGAAVVFTLWKTHSQLFRKDLSWRERLDLYSLFNVIALAAILTVPVLWVRICRTEWIGDSHSYVGLFFSYRVLHPGSGVSPVVPILLLLVSWYLWSILQTLRLRFSIRSRPRLPGNLPATTSYPLFVSDDSLKDCSSSQSSCLYQNITCLLITRQVIRRFLKFPGRLADGLLLAAYVGLFLMAVFVFRIQSLDRFLWKSGHLTGPIHLLIAPTPFDFLITALFFPLIMIALTGWLRMIFVWGSLKRGLLERLENLPLRDAFTRLHGVGWMTMIRQGGLREYWRDMARSTESMRQMVHDGDLLAAFADEKDRQKILDANTTLDANIRKLTARIGRRETDPVSPAGAPPLIVDPIPLAAPDPSEAHDLPHPKARLDLDLMCAIECNFAAFSEGLLSGILIPHWVNTRAGLVEGEDTETTPVHARRLPKDEGQKHDPIELHVGTQAEDPLYIRVAEEFLAIRYVSLIRAVLVNMRYLMTFVSMSFVLAIVAWNSYPFQPRQYIDWLFTVLLAFLGSGIIWVFAQMHRNPILSRITDTRANELGLDFYLRVITFGAVPLLTWFAYQFPDVGVGLFRFLKPGLEVMK